jgi:hypothetical protein
MEDLLDTRDVRIRAAGFCRGGQCRPIWNDGGQNHGLRFGYRRGVSVIMSGQALARRKNGRSESHV